MGWGVSACCIIDDPKSDFGNFKKILLKIFGITMITYPQELNLVTSQKLLKKQYAIYVRMILKILILKKMEIVSQ